jgi:hypothetical protein
VYRLHHNQRQAHHTRADFLLLGHLGDTQHGQKLATPGAFGGIFNRLAVTSSFGRQAARSDVHRGTLTMAR